MRLVKQATLTLMASLFFWPTSAISQSQPKNNTCDPMGRILKSSQQNLVGKLLCSSSNGTVPIVPGNSFVLCYFNPSQEQCRPKKKTRNSNLKECPLPSRSFCNRKKGGSRAEKPRIVTPYGRWLLESRPKFSWFAVDGATRYRLEFGSPRKNLWSKTTTSTFIEYPDEHAPLSPGNRYKVNVIAYKNEVPIVADSSIFRLLKSADAEDLQQMIGLIRSFNLDPDREAYLDLNAAYLSKGVLDESIKVLKARVQAGSDHPEIFTVLAERFIDARLLDEAREKYLKAIKLAKAQNNQVALKRATAGLQVLDQYQSQLPERKKGAQ